MDDTFLTWRRSYQRLRELESDLVKRSRSGEDPSVIAGMYLVVTYAVAFGLRGLEGALRKRS